MGPFTGPFLEDGDEPRFSPHASPPLATSPRLREEDELRQPAGAAQEVRHRGLAALHADHDAPALPPASSAPVNAPPEASGAPKPSVRAKLMLSRQPLAKLHRQAPGSKQAAVTELELDSSGSVAQAANVAATALTPRQRPQPGGKAAAAGQSKPGGKEGARGKQQRRPAKKRNREEDTVSEEEEEEEEDADDELPLVVLRRAVPAAAAVPPQSAASAVPAKVELPRGGVGTRALRVGAREAAVPPPKKKTMSLTRLSGASQLLCCLA
jgi:hypothetical protein